MSFLPCEGRCHTSPPGCCHLELGLLASIVRSQCLLFINWILLGQHIQRKKEVKDNFCLPGAFPPGRKLDHSECHQSCEAALNTEGFSLFLSKLQAHGMVPPMLGASLLHSIPDLHPRLLWKPPPTQKGPCRCPIIQLG